MTQNPKLQKGFTLVELVMVIILLGIVSATAIPRFFSQSTYDARFFYDELKASLQYAQKYSRATGCRVQFSLSTIQADLSVDQNCTNSSAPLYTTNINHPSDAQAYIVSVPNSVSLSGVTLPLTVEFLPQGTINNSSGNTLDSVVIQVSSSDSNRSLTLFGYSGYVQ